MPDFGLISGTLRADGYGLLTIDSLAAAAPETSANQNNRKDVLAVPARTPVFDQDMRGAHLAKTLTRTWFIFFEEIAKRLNGGAPGDLTELCILAPSIDEEDIDLYGEGSIDGTTDPVTFTPTTLVQNSRYGTTFKAGDYILWNDSGTANGFYKYEIDQITAID